MIFRRFTSSNNIGYIKITMKKILTIGFIFVILIFISLFIIQRYYYDWKLNSYMDHREKIKKDQSDNIKREYDDLVNKQTNTKSNYPLPSDTINKLQAVGSNRLNIIMVKPKNLSVSDINQLTSRLRSDNSDDTGSLKFIKTFMDNESLKYQIKDFTLSINLLGPIDMINLDQVGDMNYIWGKDPFAVMKLKDAFDNLTTDKSSIKQDKGSFIIYLYFDNSFTQNSDSREKDVYEFKKFRSFADSIKPVAYVDVYNFSPGFADFLVEAVIHEYLHLVGASDKYKEYSNKPACELNGRGEIDQTVYPQKTSDIMCGLIATGVDTYKPADLRTHTLVINRITADEIGWIK